MTYNYLDATANQTDALNRNSSILGPSCFSADSMTAAATAAAGAGSVGQFGVLSLAGSSAATSPAFSQYSMDYGGGSYSTSDLGGYLGSAGALPSLHTTARPTPYSRNPGAAVYPYYYAGRPPRSFTGYEYAACTGRQY